MYIRYNLDSFLYPTTGTEVRFKDLDLSPNNDPPGFYESVKFSIYDKNGAATEVNQRSENNDDGR